MSAAGAWSYRDGALHCEDASLEEIAERFGTPAYVYSEGSMERSCRDFFGAFSELGPQVNYAVKANSNLSILSAMARWGLGFDIVSVGELLKVEMAGGDPGKVVFSGVGKGRDEMELALEKGICFFSVESRSELDLLLEVGAAHGARVPLCVRVNPDVDPRTHPYISTGLRSNKFGVPAGEAMGLVRRIAESAAGRLTAVSCHIGSQVLDVDAMRECARLMASFCGRVEAEGLALDYVDLGGGFGIDYADPGRQLDLEGCMRAFEAELAGVGAKLMLEPGRLLVARAGALLTRVRYVKRGEERDFAVVDAGMNDLIRPALYGARHRVLPVREGAPAAAGARRIDVVGPVCESADFLAQDAGVAPEEGDLLSVMDAGAYSMAMASNYNDRPRACEVMVRGSDARIVRARETYGQMFAPERGL